MKFENMTQTIYILLTSLILLVSPAFAYETSKQVKLDAVNSYQPMQFASTKVNSGEVKNESEDLKAKTTELQDSYVEYMPINEGYISKSPVAKEEDISDLVVDMAEEPMLEGSILTKQKLSLKHKCANARVWIKGKPSSDAVLLGMWSKHMVTKNRNETNNLMALQYGGVSAGYFKNSWYKSTYFLAAARTTWHKEFKNDMSIDFQYKAGVMNGYGDHAPLRLGPVEAFLMPAFAFNYKTSGFDIWFVPNPMAAVFAFNFRVGIPDQLTYKSVHSRIETKYPPKPEVKKIEPPRINQYDQIIPQQTLITPAI